MNNSDFLPPSLLREMSQQKSGSKIEKEKKSRKEAGLGELTWSDTRFRRNTLDLQGQMAQKANVIAGGGPTCALKPGRNRALPPSGVASAGNSSSPSSQASESPP